MVITDLFYIAMTAFLKKAKLNILRFFETKITATTSVWLQFSYYDLKLQKNYIEMLLY